VAAACSLTAASLDHSAWLGNAAALGGGLAGQGAMRLRTSIIARSTGDDCVATLEGSDNLLDDASCGLPARPVTGLAADGRPTGASNAIDAVPAGRCLGLSGAALADDLRGEPRPADANRDGVTLCDIGPFEFQPRIAILHAPAPADGALLEFGGDLGAFRLAAPGQAWQAFEASPGSYRLAQTRKAGWKLTALTCAGDTDGGSLLDVKARAATIDLDPGEIITCTFAVRGGKLAPGVYTVAAQAPAGWRVAAIVCAGDSDHGSTFDPALGLAHIDLDNKETLSCLFTLARSSPTGTLTLRHVTTPAEDVAFTYTGDAGPLSLRALSRPATSLTLPAGIYRVHELLHPFWTLYALECTGDGDGGTLAQLETATAVVDLDAGEAITCVFRHARATAGTGSITVVQATGAAEPATFAYSGDLGEFALALPDDVTRAWPALVPGIYSMRQTTTGGWRLDGITCDGDTDGGTVMSPGEGSVSFDLDAGEAIVCTFTNTRRAAGQGSLTVVHAPAPADDTGFRYTGVFGDFTLRSPAQPSQSFAALAAGTYPVTIRLPEGWRAGLIDCTGDGDMGSAIDVAAGRVMVDLDANEAITCTFRPTRSDAPPPAARLAFVPILRR